MSLFSVFPLGDYGKGGFNGTIMVLGNDDALSWLAQELLGI